MHYKSILGNVDRILQWNTEVTLNGKAGLFRYEKWYRINEPIPFGRFQEMEAVDWFFLLLWFLSN